jgi:hypothetical protein
MELMASLKEVSFVHAQRMRRIQGGHGHEWLLPMLLLDASAPAAQSAFSCPLADEFPV